MFRDPTNSQGACVSEGATMLVTEFMEGGDLWRILSRDTDRSVFGWYKRCVAPLLFVAWTSLRSSRHSTRLAAGLFEHLRYHTLVCASAAAVHQRRGVCTAVCATTSGAEDITLRNSYSKP